MKQLYLDEELFKGTEEEFFLSVIKYYCAKWRLNAKIEKQHGPTVIFNNNIESWFLEEEPHRFVKPSLFCENEYEAWHQFGKLHRIDGPAVNWYGEKKWYQNGVNITEYAEFFPVVNYEFKGEE